MRLGVLVICVAACGSAPPPVVSAQANANHSIASTSTASTDPDRDRDGIPNECDACPDAPETFNGICDEDGCPDIAVDDFTSGIVTIQSVLLFDKQSPRVSEMARPLLEQVAHTMLTNKDALDLVLVLGHASRVESDGDAIALARASAVRDALIAHGVDAAHVEARGAGARKPLDDKDAQLNQRVEFIVLRSSGHEQFHVNGDAIEPIESRRSSRPACEPRPPTCAR